MSEVEDKPELILPEGMRESLPATQRASTALWSEAPQRMRDLAEAHARFAEAWMHLALAPITALGVLRRENFSPMSGTGSETAH